MDGGGGSTRAQMTRHQAGVGDIIITATPAGNPAPWLCELDITNPTL